ncbi:Hypothetical protein GbCGDNIH9_2357 [Granulibacter bethesdensis]|uniref:Uncharacterized protein n=1 Tax=Granulibacter bethesdensis TaxID=364410 RepID=A0AAC9KG50_9PROT|nr:Hypothetical protein GbCGDNIH9_2357 [Granulibacter bethesdensis]APH63273.1 Hypothetical protein GbCGDNIH8_2357 [Granulibacter bethesdensis]
MATGVGTAALTGAAGIPVITATPTGVGLIGEAAAAGAARLLPLLRVHHRRDHGPVRRPDLPRGHRLVLRVRAGLRQYSLNKQIILIRTGAVKMAPVSVLAH